MLYVFIYIEANDLTIQQYLSIRSHTTIHDCSVQIANSSGSRGDR